MLNQDQISNYHKDGYLSGVSILNEVEAGHYREQFDALEKREGHEKCQIGLQSRHFEERFIWELASKISNYHKDGYLSGVSLENNLMQTLYS